MTIKPLDRIHQALLTGRALDFTPVIDCHAHFGQWSSTAVPDSLDHAKALRAMDAWGIDIAIFSAAEPGYGGDLSLANDRVIDFVKAAPERIMGYCTLSASGPEGNLDELVRCAICYAEHAFCSGVTRKHVDCAISFFWAQQRGHFDATLHLMEETDDSDDDTYLTEEETDDVTVEEETDDSVDDSDDDTYLIYGIPYNGGS